MKNYSIFLNLFILVFSLFMFVSCAEKKPEKEAEKQEMKENAKHSDIAYQCPMDCEDGKTYHETGSCPVCKMDLKEASTHQSGTCKMHKDGKCSCEGKKCKCKDCKEHTTAMTCEQHKDSKCTCEGEKCACANCAEHT
ncbi:heavy metal-binding domain-containing protein [Lutimonas sp.]|uniref:heavy metal-binding domain-containing protein n=1 Tax=Lutimonas sp. TaxID=1872403 RepID=UPI003D9B4043